MGAKGTSGTRPDWVERKAGCYAPSLKTPAVDAVYYDNTLTTIREVTSGHDEEFVDDGIITSVEVAPDERGQNSILARLFDRLHKFTVNELEGDNVTAGPALSRSGFLTAANPS